MRPHRGPKKQKYLSPDTMSPVLAWVTPQTARRARTNPLSSHGSDRVASGSGSRSCDRGEPRLDLVPPVGLMAPTARKCPRVGPSSRGEPGGRGAHVDVHTCLLLGRAKGPNQIRQAVSKGRETEFNPQTPESSPEWDRGSLGSTTAPACRRR